MRLIAEDGAPVMNAAGQVKTVEEFRQAHRSAVGAVVVGSYTIQERAGNPGSTYYGNDALSINSLGLPGPSIDIWTQWVREMAKLNDDMGDKPLWVSVAGFAPEEYRIMAEAALEAGADLVELNLGCPNVWGPDGQKPIASYDLDLLFEVVDVVFDQTFDGSRTEPPIGVKLSPLFDPILLERIDAILVNYGVAFVTTMNTVPNCFVTDSAGRPAIDIGNEMHLGGLSGPAIKPIALGQVIQHRAFLGDIPLIGAGGVTTGGDVQEFLDHGCVAVQLGHAWATRGPSTVAEIVAGMTL